MFFFVYTYSVIENQELITRLVVFSEIDNTRNMNPGRVVTKISAIFEFKIKRIKLVQKKLKFELEEEKPTKTFKSTGKP